MPVPTVPHLEAKRNSTQVCVEYFVVDLYLFCQCAYLIDVMADCCASTLPLKKASSGTSQPSSSQTASIRFKLRSGEDTYVIVTLATIGYGELINKIYKKLKNCGVSKDSASKIKIRYEDEEGDLILICNDDDVFMAVEWMRVVGVNHLSLVVD